MGRIQNEPWNVCSMTVDQAPAFDNCVSWVSELPMVKKSPFKFPTERYLNVVKRGYKDCNLDKKYLNKALIIQG